MSNNNMDYKAIGAEAGAIVGLSILVNLGQNLVMYALQPDVLVEEKKTLRTNREILRKNFTK